MDCLFCQGTGVVRTLDPHAETDLTTCYDCQGTREISMMQLLASFPEQLKRLSESLLRAEVEIRKYQAKVDRLTSDIELAIAQDNDLKNEQQRKAKRSELLKANDYQTALIYLREAEDSHQRLKIKRQHAADQFAVAKLMAQEHIASLAKS
jgi:septal ring factor EnvC (AmiA/AmiB activator)